MLLQIMVRVLSTRVLMMYAIIFLQRNIIFHLEKLLKHYLLKSQIQMVFERISLLLNVTQLCVFLSIGPKIDIYVLSGRKTTGGDLLAVALKKVKMLWKQVLEKFMKRRVIKAQDLLNSWGVQFIPSFIMK